MTRSRMAVLFSGILALAGIFAWSSIGTAAVPSVTFNGNTYYAVDGNNPTMNSGDKVCASMKMKCLGYKSVNTNAICKLFHPTAKELTSVNGSKAGFYCNGAPQQGLACAKYKNTCEVCPNCNLNEAASCSSTIGQHFREMYVFCEATTSKSPMYGPLPMPKFSSSSAKSSSSLSPIDSRIGQPSGYKVCEYYQATKAGDPVRATKKLVSCGVPGLGDKFCKTALNNQAAKALKCEENGIVVCGLPCTTPGARNEWFCSADINRLRGTMVKPLDFCPPLTSSSTSSTAKKPAGQLCANGGECQTGYCLGVVPGREYRCSCKQLTYATSGCSSSASSLPNTGRAPGQLCQHGGQCQSGMCLGVVPGQEYRCSCNDPKTAWQGCRR